MCVPVDQLELSVWYLYSITVTVVWLLPPSFRDLCKPLSWPSELRPQDACLPDLKLFSSSSVVPKVVSILPSQNGVSHTSLGFPWWSSNGKESACSVGDPGSIPGSGKSPGEGMATHFSILACRIPWTREAWRATVHGVTKSWTGLSN